VLNAGTNVLVGTFTPTDTANYTSGATITNTVVVGKGSHTISFGSLPTKQLGDAAFSLTGSASSGLGVSYTSANPSVATVSGNTVTIVGDGTTAIVANQGGNGNWNSANPVTNSLTVLPRTVLTISGASVSNKVYDGNRTATVTWSGHTLVGAASNHDVRLVSDSAVGTYDSANAGVGKSVSVTGLSLSGADAGRYELGSVLLLTGTIDPKGLGVSGLVVNKRGYEGEGEVRALLEWDGHELSGKVIGDEVYVQEPYGEGKYEDGLVGVNKAVTWWNRDPVLGGAAASNYYVEFPEGVLFGEVEKGEVVPMVSGTQRVYNGQRQGVSAVAMVGSNNLAVVTKYWGLSNTVYPTNELGPIDAGSYGVEVKVAESEQNYGGATNVVLTIAKKAAVIMAGSDTIRAGTAFNSNNYSSSGFLTNIGGGLVTLRSGANSNLPVSYDSSSTLGGVYRILRGSVGDSVSQNYQIEYREGTLTVLKQSVVTEGTVMPLGMGQGFTAVVMSNGAVTNWGTNTLTIPTVINPNNFGTTNFVGARGLGTGGAASFALAWLGDGSGIFWGSTTNSVSNEPFGVAMMVGLPQVGGTWVGLVRDNGAQEVIPSTIPGGQVTGRVVGMAAGSTHGLSLLSDGTVKAWGKDDNGDNKLIVPAGLSNAVGVAAGLVQSVALKADGTVEAWGRNENNATAVPDELSRTNATNFVRVVAVTAAGLHNLALRADGSLRWWGPNNHILNPGHSSNAGLGLENTNNPVVAMGVSTTPHAAAVRRNGQVVVWGNGNTSITTVNTNLRAMVPMGGADSDGDGWANEAELRVGTDPLSTNSVPEKASFGVNFRYGSVGSSFVTNRVVPEGSNPVVGTLDILDAMGRLEDGNQAQMTVELGLEAQKRFELVTLSSTNRELRFKSAPVYDAVQTNNNVYAVEVFVKDSGTSGTLRTTLTVDVGNVAPRMRGNTIFSVDENVVEGTVVGALEATESNVTWSITSGNELGLFAIDGQSGQIRTAKPINYEDEALTDKTIALVVRVTDAGGAASSADVEITVRDVLEGMTPEVWLAGSGWTEMTQELLLKYAVGGALSPTGSSENTVTVMDSNKLSLTAIIRTNDLSLTVRGEAGVDLSNWSTNGVSHTPSASQANVAEGCERRIYSVDRANSPSRQFLRLKVTR
jgi:hypothetical protein